ncbi:MAG: hypothetical protein H7Z74_12610 [Anaerolineae bacterium]|nr:hypothetical protein [Gemmatimonadaceae bacterium]
MAAFMSVALSLVASATATAQRTPGGAASRGTKVLSGQMLPLEPLPAGMQPVVSAALARIRMAGCKPPQPSGGPGPTSFFPGFMWPSGIELEWPAVPGAVAYLVERAVDGTSDWIVAASTCGSPDAIREYERTSGQTRIWFRDIAGGVELGKTYVYKVTAVGAAGEVGWNSVRWSPPPYTPSFTTTVTGSTVVLTASQPCQIFTFTSLWSQEMEITASYGFSRIVPTNNACGSTSISPVTIYGVPEGTHTFTVAALWTQSLDPAMPRVVGRSSASALITIKP